MPRRSDYVRCSGKTGSDWQPTKPSRRTYTGHRRPKSATGTPAGLRNFGVIPGVMNWAVLRDFAFGSTHICRLSSQTAASQEALMSIKRILVPLPGSASHTGQIETALSAEKALGAHVQALFISQPPPVTRGGVTATEMGRTVTAVNWHAEERERTARDAREV